MRIYLIAITLCLMIVGCTPKQDDQILELRNEIADLKSEVSALKIQLAVQNQEIERLAAHIDAIPNAAPVSNENWVLWETARYFGNQLRSSIPSKALDALQSKIDCLNSAKSYVASQTGSDDGSLAFQKPAGGGYDVVTMVCLPEGTHP